MTNHPNRGNPGLTYPEARAILGVLGDVDPAHFEDRGAAYEANAKSGESKLNALVRGSVMVPFTKQEITVLMNAIGNGAEGVLQSSSGFRPDEKRAFAAAANRLIDAVKLDSARY